MDPDMQIGRFVIGTIVMILAAMVFGAAVMMLWMKEKYEIWSDSEIKHKMRNN